MSNIIKSNLEKNKIDYIQKLIDKNMFNLYHFQYLNNRMPYDDLNFILVIIENIRKNSEYFLSMPILKRLLLEFVTQEIDILKYHSGVIYSDDYRSIQSNDYKLVRDSAIQALNILTNNDTVHNITDIESFERQMNKYKNLSLEDKLVLARNSLSFDLLLSDDTYEKFAEEPNENIRSIAAKGMPDDFLIAMFINYPTERMKGVLKQQGISLKDIQDIKREMNNG